MNVLLSRRTLLAALIGGAAGVQAAGAPSAQHRPSPRGSTPTLHVPAWEGPPWSLANARGQVVLLNFWASWCEPCRAEMPSLELLAERHIRDRVQVMAVKFRENDNIIA